MIYPIKNIVDILNEYHYVKNSIIRANNLLNVKEEIFDGNKLEVKGNIIIKNLLYSYNNKNNLLDNISFYINERDRVLIMGDSGVGKSTILKLIYKYFDVDRYPKAINYMKIGENIVDLDYSNIYESMIDEAKKKYIKPLRLLLGD